MGLSVIFIRTEPGDGGNAPMPLGTKTPVPVGASVFLGRGAHAQVPMHDHTIARLHALLAVTPDGQRLVVVDLFSTNGTWSNGQQRQVVMLAAGEEFRIANRYWFRVVGD